MKKLFVAAMALALLVAFSVPAFAFTTEFGGRIRTDIGWTVDSKERTDNGDDDIVSGFLSVASSSYFRVTFNSKDKKVGARIEMGLGGTVTRRTVFGWYQMGNCKLVAGNNYTWMGDGVIGVSDWLIDPTTGHGHAYMGRMPMIALEWRAGNHGVQIGLFEPQASAPGAVNDFRWVAPQLHITGDLKFGSVRLAPSFGIAHYLWEQDNGDDSFIAYYVGLPVSMSFGPVTIKMNLMYSVNGDADFGQMALATPVVKANGDIENSASYGGWLEVGYKVGAVTFHVGYGVGTVTNDEWKDTLGYKNDDYTQQKFYFHVNYQLHANLALRPEIGYIDYGDAPSTGADAGSAWLFGLRFQFVF